MTIIETTQLGKIWYHIKERISMNYKDIAVRALKTFGQGIVGYLVAHATNLVGINSLSGGKQFALAALVAGVSLAWNLVLVPAWQPVKAKLGL